VFTPSVRYVLNLPFPQIVDRLLYGINQSRKAFYASPIIDKSLTRHSVHVCVKMRPSEDMFVIKRLQCHQHLNNIDIVNSKLHIPFFVLHMI
jgi:hypothetical protein